MKIVYLSRNPGIASRTPHGIGSVVIAAGPGDRYADTDLREMADADFLVVGLEPVGAAVFALAKRLKLVQRLGVGYENIDLAAATRHGVPVCNMPDFNAGTVAEHAIMLMLALLRRAFESTLLMKSGHWPLSTVAAQGLFDLRGRTLGLVGLGRIGREVATRAAAFDVRLCYFDAQRISASQEEALGIRYADFDTLLTESDIVSLHVPGTAATTCLIGADELGRMKPTAMLINTARGAVVDEEALAAALQAGRIAGAGLDVFSEEPLGLRHPLRKCRNVILTPHTAGQTREAMERMMAMLLENIERVLRHEEPRYRVNPIARPAAAAAGPAGEPARRAVR